MKLETGIDSIEARIQEEKLVIWSKTPLKVLSSAVLNGGLREANGILNVHVLEDGSRDDEIHRNASDFMQREVSKLELPQDQVVGLMTAADMRNAVVMSQRHGNLTLSTFVTAGSSISATAGDEIASKRGGVQFKKFGTINIIVLVDGNLTESCMVGTVATVTEAKTVALRELDIRSHFSGDLASGTITDSIIVACTKRGSPMEYAGTAMMLGELVSKSTKESVKKAIHNQDGLVPSRHLIKRLEERGISMAKMMTHFSQNRPHFCKNVKKLQQFEEELRCILSDEKVASFVIAGFRLDDDVKMGLIPKSPAKTIYEKSDVCEILQTAVTEYLSKKNYAPKSARTNYSSPDLDKKCFFTQNILFAIMNNVFLKIFSR